MATALVSNSVGEKAKTMKPAKTVSRICVQCGLPFDDWADSRIRFCPGCREARQLYFVLEANCLGHYSRHLRPPEPRDLDEENCFFSRASRHEESATA